MPLFLDCPRLRPGLALARDRTDPRFVVLWDQLGLGRKPQRLNLLELAWIEMFNGQRTLYDIQIQATHQLNGEFLPLEWLTALVQRMDEALFLDGPRFREHFASNPIREPTCIGSYKGDPDDLRRQLHALFTGPQGPGLPRPVVPDGKLRAALIPHMDYYRGGTTYAWGFKEVVERTDAALFVIIGTSHKTPTRFTLTRKHYKTPLGIAPTDQEYIDLLVGHYGAGLFDDEVYHLWEHSIELEVVFLQYLYEGRRPIRIVPLMVGAFNDCVVSELAPQHFPDIRRMVEALQHTEEETREPICYIISGDLAHIGPDFGDALPLEQSFLDTSRRQDQAILRQTETADPLAYFHVIAEESDRRRICGLPPTYTTLAAARPRHGKVLHYDQYIHPQGRQSVSFASVAFYR